MSYLVIDADRRRLRLDLREILAYKELLFTLAYRDFRVRYAQTALGVLWGVVQPLVTLGIFVILFNQALKVDTGDVPYPLYALAGLSAWTYFSFLLSNAGSAIIGSAQMIQKIYFPRLVIPLSKAIVGFVEFGIALAFMIPLMLYYRFVPPPSIVYFPLFVLLTVIAGLTAGIWLGALTIRFRDLQHVIPFLVRIGLYVTPVAYPASMVPEKYRALYYLLNPVAGVVEGFRWSLVGGEAPHFYAWVSFLLLLLLLVSGLFYFKRVERVMADIL